MKALRKFVLLLALAASGAEAPVAPTAGVGVILGVKENYITVERILPNSPAAASNTIHGGDRILAVAQDREPAIEVTNGRLADAVRMFRGPIGTTVRLTVVPAGEDNSKARVVSFVRGEIKELSDWGDGVLLPNGTKAPDIEMLGLANGKAERLSDYAGKIIVLEFWATWCGPCQPKMATLQTYSEKFPDWKGQVVLLAASVDEKQDAPAKHVQEKEWNRTHNVWVGREAKRAYHIDGIPTVYLINRQGNIVSTNPKDLPEIVTGEIKRGRD